MLERQTNIRIDSNTENVWIEHFVEDKEGNEYEDSERITLRLTGNLALDSLAFYNEFMRTIPKMTVEHLKRDLEDLENGEYSESDALDGSERKEHEERQDETTGAK